MLLFQTLDVYFHRHRNWSGWSSFGQTTTFKVKTKFPFMQKQVINRCINVIFRLVRLQYYLIKLLSTAHAINYIVLRANLA